MWLTACQNTANKEKLAAQAVEKDSDGNTVIKASDFSALTTQIWAADFMVSAKDSTPTDCSGKWYQFFDNGHRFEFGRWGETLQTGTWKYEHANHLLDLNFNKETTERTQWYVRLTGNQAMMIWIGNTPRNPSGDQMKLEHVDKKPTQKG